MFFLFAAMHPQLVDQGIVRVEGGDGFGGEDRGQALLPEVVEDFDFALGLRREGLAACRTFRPANFHFVS